jgi:hypothetical protein
LHIAIIAPLHHQADKSKEKEVCDSESQQSDDK